MPSITTAKARLRSQVRAQAAAIPGDERQRSDWLLAGRFLGLPQTAQAQTLLLFRGIGTEPDTRPILEAMWRQGKAVLLPKCLPHRAMEARLVTDPAQLVPGPFGIPEPGEDCRAVEADRIDLILVPDLCCDKGCFRLGQGGGYYDRYLAAYRGRTVALCRDVLLRDEVPTDHFDRPVELVLTETRSFRLPLGDTPGWPLLPLRGNSPPAGWPAGPD